MKFIAHRGCLTGPKKELENTTKQINKALVLGYEVEIDVRCTDGDFWLGHDNPIEKVTSSFLNNKKLWVHAKDIQTLYELLLLDCVCFYHNSDDVTLTSNQYLWTYVGKELTYNSIAVLPEQSNYTDKELSNCAGFCSDYITEYTKYKF